MVLKKEKRGVTTERGRTKRGTAKDVIGKDLSKTRGGEGKY